MTKRRNGMRGESGREKSSPRKIEELSRENERESERVREWDSAADSFCRSERGEYFGVG